MDTEIHLIPITKIMHHYSEGHHSLEIEIDNTGLPPQRYLIPSGRPLTGTQSHSLH